MQRHGLALLISLASATTAAAGAADEANAVIDQWSAKYSANDTAGLLDLYAADAVLLGTTSPVISEGRDAIKEYFKDLPGSGRKIRSWRDAPSSWTRTPSLEPDFIVSPELRKTMRRDRRGSRWLL